MSNSHELNKGLKPLVEPDRLFSQRVLWRGARLACYGLVLLGMLSACTGEIESSLRVEQAYIGTQRVMLESTATVQSARIQTTLDYSSTRVSFAATQSQLLKATLIGAGTPAEVLEAFQRNFMLTVPPTPLPDTLATPVGAESPLQVTPFSLPSPSPVATGARLENVVMAQSVGANDCANNVTSVFRTDSAQIYVVATAIDVPRGTLISSRWLLRNEEVIRYDFTPDFDIQRACIWFFIDPADVRFEVGEWSVILDLNGQAATAPIVFRIDE